LHIEGGVKLIDTARNALFVVDARSQRAQLIHFHHLNMRAEDDGDQRNVVMMSSMPL
jgi:hypothetical protein